MDAKRYPGIYLFAVALAAASVSSFALADEARAPTWYEYIVGVIGIPAALIALVYSYLLIKKTRLETRKIELEIQAQGSQVQKALQSQPDEVRNLLAPFTASRVSQYLVLRFVLLYLILKLWDLVTEIYDFLIGGVALGADKIWHLDFDNSGYMPMLFVLNELPRIGYWAIFFTIGWPLFKDINSLLGLDLKQIFGLKSNKV